MRAPPDIPKNRRSRHGSYFRAGQDRRMPPRTPGPHPHLEPAPSAADPARVRDLPQSASAASLPARRRAAEAATRPCQPRPVPRPKTRSRRWPDQRISPGRMMWTRFSARTTPHRTWIRLGLVASHRAGPGRTRARRWPQVRRGADRLGRSPRTPGATRVLVRRADLGEFHFAPRLVTPSRGTRHDLSAGQGEPVDAPPLAYRSPAGRVTAVLAQRAT